MNPLSLITDYLALCLARGGMIDTEPAGESE